MNQSLLPPMCFQGVVSLSKVLLVLSTRAEPLYSEQHQPMFGTKPYSLGQDFSSSLQPIWNLPWAHGTYFPGPFVFQQQSPPLRIPALKALKAYIMVIHKLNEPVSHPALGFWNVGPQSAVRAQHANRALVRFSLLPSRLMKSLLMHCSNTVWEDEAEFLAGFFPCYFLVLLLLMLSHAEFMTVAFESWGQLDPAGPCCKWIRLPVWAEDEHRGSHSENNSGEQGWNRSWWPSFQGWRAFLLMLCCSGHDSVCSHHTALKGWPCIKSSVLFQLRWSSGKDGKPSLPYLLLCFVQVISNMLQGNVFIATKSLPCN